jgi:precorrin-6B methylase 2
MPAEMSDEFEGLCVGLDIALCRPHAKIVTIEDSHKRLDSAIREALSGFGTADLVNLKNFLSDVLANEDPAKNLEELWMSLKPTKVFFGGSNADESNSAYVFIFKQVQRVIEDKLTKGE